MKGLILIARQIFAYLFAFWPGIDAPQSDAGCGALRAPGGFPPGRHGPGRDPLSVSTRMHGHPSLTGDEGLLWTLFVQLTR